MNNKYDIKEPTIGHFNRFQAKLERQEKPKIKKNWYQYIAIAASLLLLFSIGLGSINTKKGLELADISPKMEETQLYFSSVINTELEKISKEQNEDNKQIIDDALAQLKLLEKSYQKQTISLKQNNQNKKIIYAMISNFQQRITVLQNLLQDLNNFKQLKNNAYENSNI